MKINVLDYLENSAELYPNKIAFADENNELTFQETRMLAKAIGTKINECSPVKLPIVVYMEKTANCLPVFLGTAYANCFYVPIDEKMPLERIERIIDNLKPSCVICDSKNIDTGKEISKNAHLLIYEEIVNTKVDEKALAEVRRNFIDTDLLYVLFTSGSTGDPKGVTICHKSVIDYTEWLCENLELDHDTIFGNQAPFHFDNSILDIYTTLKQASTMYVIPQRCFSFPKTMVKFLNEKQINTIFWVPFALISLANSGILEKFVPEHLKRIYFCGEVMPCKQLNMWRRAIPKARYCNMYGPTEITDVCTYYVVDREFEDDDSLPIGFACENTRIILLDDNDKEPIPGEIGELCVVGTSLSFGYYNNLEKTSEVFVQNPLNTTYREIIYRTGDLVKYNERSEIIYLSRKDFQIKHKGYRIELGEIETALLSVLGIENGCCLYDDSRLQITCFYVGDVDCDKLRVALAAKLPDYMIPERYEMLESLPQTSNGKINRVALKKQYITEG